MVMVEEMVNAPLFVAENGGMLPVPLDGNPMRGLLLVHEKEVPVIGPDRAVNGAFWPLQYV